MNPFDAEKSQPNFWLSCMIIDEDAMAPMVRGEQDYLYKHEKRKELPSGNTGCNCCFQCRRDADLEAYAYAADLPNNAFVTVEGNGRGNKCLYSRIWN